MKTNEAKEIQNFEEIFDGILDRAVVEGNLKDSWWKLKHHDFEVYERVVACFDDAQKIDFYLYMAKFTASFYSTTSSYTGDDRPYRKSWVARLFMGQIMKSRPQADDERSEALIRAAIKYNNRSKYPVFVPLQGILNQISKKYKNPDLPENLKQVLSDLDTKLTSSTDFCSDVEHHKIKGLIREILGTHSSKNETDLLRFPGEDPFVEFANSYLNNLTSSEKKLWLSIINLSTKASGSKPALKYLQEAKKLIGIEALPEFKKAFIHLAEFLISFKGTETTVPDEGPYFQYQFISAPAAETMKGLVWVAACFPERDVLEVIASLADKCYKKIPWHGQICTVVGNACVVALAKSEGLEGIGLLSRLRVKIKLPSTLRIIEKNLEMAAAERRIPVSDLEDLSVDDFGLVDASKAIEIGDYTAVLRVEKLKVNVLWRKKDNSYQKAEPSSLKEQYSGELKKVKIMVKQIEQSLSAQKERLDNNFKMLSKYSAEHFFNCYFNHGLLSLLTRKLIWSFSTEDQQVNLLWLDSNWINSSGEVVQFPKGCSISLWHPATASTEEVKAWRQLLIRKEITQPIKQAFREVYLLTDAEVNTNVYSNRMAAHILKQHQFMPLAKARNWRYMIQGQFDNGADGIASTTLPTSGLIAQYWTIPVDGEQATDAGIFGYITTDQVRFLNQNTRETVPLAEVPVHVFSEVMRDVDLFVAVSSVGNDPLWRDNGGLPGYHEYWSSYSFGELSEVAKNRRETVKRLLPRLKISKVAELKDKFLIVKGKKRTYKIHLGSTNILMEPNDQYLCIVPDRSRKDPTEKLFLPFEGDSGLSVIISKAIMLADDDKITDRTITTQIERA
ncbi:DUF4132 domain-containing protein [Desertivirga brevis]|uniref:DUF4132 domain-containing protein n=1 Tax=Desertivirga brevis TaxID=2810310 RepID=UPI001A95A7C7